MNTHPHIDTSRPWHVRMAQARRWHLARLHVKRPPNHDALMAVVADVVAHRMPGWTTAPEPTPQKIRTDYRRVIRRNLGNGRLP